MDLSSLFPFSYPSWVIEVVSHPILLTIAIVCGLMLYQQLKRKLANGDISLSDNQAKIIGLVGIIILIFMARS